jgi:hypothetical protein
LPWFAVGADLNPMAGVTGQQGACVLPVLSATRAERKDIGRGHSRVDAAALHQLSPVVRRDAGGAVAALNKLATERSATRSLLVTFCNSRL